MGLSIGIVGATGQVEARSSHVALAERDFPAARCGSSRRPDRGPQAGLHGPEIKWKTPRRKPTERAGYPPPARPC